MKRLALCCVLAAGGCKADDLLSDLPDAELAPDALDLPAGNDWSCLDAPWPTDAPTALTITSGVSDPGTGTGLGGVAVSLIDFATGAVLGTGTTSTSVQSRGAYSISIATDGTAPVLVRKATMLGRLDAYGTDPVPASLAWLNSHQPLLDALGSLNSITAEERDSYYGAVGATATPGRGLLFLSANDCIGQRVEGATFDVPGAEAVIYELADHTFGPTSLELTATTTDGQGMALNVPPGDVLVTVHVGGFTYRSRPVRIVADALAIAERIP